MKHRWLTLSALLFVVLIRTDPAGAQSTQFTYQGRLQDGGVVANGNYDFEFKLFDAASGGNQQGSTIQLTVGVSNGTFTVQLDFGNTFPGANRFLELGVRPAGSGNFTLLNPRQPVTSTPYSIRSANATAADGLSVSCVNCVTSAQIGSVNGSAITGAIPVASVPTGNGNYIQNTSSPQASSNFNISGTGTADILNAATQFNLNGSRVLRAAGPNTFVGLGAGGTTTGPSNTFFGTNAGAGNTSGGNNAFFGDGAGRFINGGQNSFFGTQAGSDIANTGPNNSFFGALAGFRNTSGQSNVFVGASAGLNTSTGNFNVFVGQFTGGSNTTGTANTFVGNGAGGGNSTGNTNTAIGVGAGQGLTGNNNTLLGASTNTNGNVNFGTAIGYGAVVASNNTVVIGRNLDSVQIPGSLSIAGSLSSSGANLTDLDATNVTTGTIDAARLGNGAILNQTTQQASSNFRISGTGTANILNATTHFSINGDRVLLAAGSNTSVGRGSGENSNAIANSFFGTATGGTNTTGSSNSFFGAGVGQINTTGSGNSFFGAFAGNVNSTGSDNSSFGVQAGAFNTTADRNSAFGARAGFSNQTGTENAYFGFEAGKSATTSSNSFFGSQAGHATTTGANNSFFGASSGLFNTTGGDNAFFGVNTGRMNTAGNENSFFGRLAGRNNTTGDDNTFVGRAAGDNNTTGSNNTVIGANANLTDGLNFATAIGAGASVSTSNTIVLGRGNDKVNMATLNVTDKAMINLGVNGSGVVPVCSDLSTKQLQTCSTSSMRYKSDIRPLTFGLDLIKRLRPVEFNWKSNHTADIGLIAEEVNAIEPRLTFASDAGQVEGVKYSQVGVVLINAVKEQQSQIELLQRQIRNQTALIEAQHAELKALKQIVCARNPKAPRCQRTKR